MILAYLICWIVGIIGISIYMAAGRGKLTLRDVLGISVGWGTFGIPLMALFLVLGSIYVAVEGLNRVTLWKGKQR